MDKPISTTAFLLTGRPGIRKTTVVQNTISLLGGRSAGGFYTREVRRQGWRVGFELVTLDGEVATLATRLPHTFANARSFGRYTVNLDAVDRVGCRPWSGPGRTIGLSSLMKLDPWNCCPADSKTSFGNS